MYTARLPQPPLLAALCALLLVGSSAGAAARPMSPAPMAEAPAAEPNVTAMDGRRPILDAVAGSVGGRLVGAVAAAAAASAGAGSLVRPSWLPSGTFSGDGTAYSESVPGTGAGFACSYRYLNEYFSTHFAAINKPMWDEGRACGRCINAWCVDERCKVRDRKIKVKVVDLCPECAHGDVDFSIPVYRDITGMWPHRLAVQWEWADCADEIQGDILLTPKDGINPFWQAFYFANQKYPLKSVRLNGKELERNEFQFWIHAAPLSKPAQFEFEAVNGMKLAFSLDDPLREQKVPNFP